MAFERKLLAAFDRPHGFRNFLLYRVEGTRR
jgi:hypothetical protein